MKLSGRAAVAALAMIVTMCASSRPEPLRPWRIEVATSGGLTGRGIGAYAIDSDGNITIVSADRRTCETRAAAEELYRIEALLAATDPRRWDDSYAPDDRCCDRIEYTLTLEEPSGTYTTEWIDAPLPRPESLVALTDAIVGGTDSVRTRHECW